MTILQAVDKTGRMRLVEPVFEELGPAFSVEFAFAMTSDLDKTRNFRLLSHSTTDAEQAIASFQTEPFRQKYERVDRTTRDTNVTVFKDALNNSVYFRTDEAIIGFASRSAAKVEEASSKYGLRMKWFDRLGNFGLFDLGRASINNLFKLLQADEQILFAEPNILDGSDLPVISDLESDGVSPPIQPLWNHQVIKRSQNVSPNDGLGVVVAVVDTPIALDHPGFANALCLNTHELHFGDSPPLPMSHGTSVASILVDSTLVGHGVSLGLCPSAKLLPISIDTASTSSYAKRAMAINYLAQGVKNKAIQTKSSGQISLPRLIVNCSWQVRGNQDLTSVALAFANLASAGAVCVCSAGNDNTNKPHFPSDYNACHSVAGITNTLVKSKNSNYGTKVSFSMPAGDGTPYGEEDILAAQGPNYLDYVSGTSFAAPHASGVLAALWSKNPNLTGREVVNLAKNNYSSSLDLQNPTLVGQLGAGLICFN